MRVTESDESVGRRLKRPLSPPIVFGIVGASGSGKTQLGAALIRGLKKAARDLRIAAIKHCPHGHEADREGSDTSRLRDAGANSVIASSPGQVTSFSTVEEDSELHALIAKLSVCHEVVIVEGYRSSSLPKVLVSGAALAPESVTNVVATFGSGSDGETNVPNFADTDTAELVEWIMANPAMRLKTPLVSLRVNGVAIDLKRFPSEALAGIVRGFVDSLDGIPQGYCNIDLSITRSDDP